MKKKFDYQRGFTLIEMMVVMLIISVLLIITIPNVAKRNSNINKKGCEAYIKMVEAQVQAFKMDNDNTAPTLDTLKSQGYLRKDVSGCPNGQEIVIDAEGNVTAVAQTN